MKKFLPLIIFSPLIAMMPEDASKDFKPDEYISNLNGISGEGLPKKDLCKLPNCWECPYRCKSYYVKMMVESIKKLIEDLFKENLIDLETMEYQLKALQNERTHEIFKEILEHVNKLKDE